MEAYLAKPGTLDFDLQCPLTIVHLSFNIAIFGVGLLLIELKHDLLVGFVVHSLYLPVKVDVESAEDDVFGADLGFGNGDVLIILFHVEVKEAHLLDVDCALAVVGSELGLRTIVAADCVIDALLVEADYLRRVVRDFFGNEADFISNILVSFTEHWVKWFPLANLG